MSLCIVQDLKIHTMLFEVDQELAAACRQRGCLKCGGPLHCGNFPRKPRGVPLNARDLYSTRFSFDCGQCDKRTTPNSARFLGRHLYVALVVALVCPRGPAHRSWLCTALNVTAATVRRWRRQWQERFVQSPVWMAKRADFASPVDESALPGSAIARFSETDDGTRVVQFLRWLAT